MAEIKNTAVGRLNHEESANTLPPHPIAKTNKFMLSTTRLVDGSDVKARSDTFCLLEINGSAFKAA